MLHPDHPFVLSEKVRVRVFAHAEVYVKPCNPPETDQLSTSFLGYTYHCECDYSNHIPRSIIVPYSEQIVSCTNCCRFIPGVNSIQLTHTLSLYRSCIKCFSAGLEIAHSDKFYLYALIRFTLFLPYVLYLLFV